MEINRIFKRGNWILEVYRFQTKAECSGDCNNYMAARGHYRGKQRRRDNVYHVQLTYASNHGPVLCVNTGNSRSSALYNLTVAAFEQLCAEECRGNLIAVTTQTI